MKKIVLILVSLMAFCGIAKAQSEIVIPSDWISFNDDVYISGRGEVVEVPFGYYIGGITEDALIEQIEIAISDAGLEDVITDVSVDYTMPLLEGSIYLTFSINLSLDEREVAVSASSGGATIYQPVAESDIFTLSGGTTPIWHGQEFTLRLSGHDDFASYRIKRTSGGIVSYNSEYTPGTGGQLLFKDSRDGVYTAESNYPSYVQMSGSRTISYLPFYNLNHSFSTASYTVSPNGEKITVPFTSSASADLTQLATIISAYNGGQSKEWDDRMQLSYASGVLTMLAAPNLGDTTIVNNTWFKNSSSATLTFTQQGGGALIPQSVTLSNGGHTMTLAGSQPFVTYSLVNSEGAAVTTVTGTGDPIVFLLPSNAVGTYTITASYAGRSITMQDAVVVTPGGAVLRRDNFILKETSLSPSGTSVIRDITYYDGLGYPEQVISVAGAPDGKNIVTPVWYDAARRDDARTYLPYVSNGILPERESAAFTAQQSWYTARYGSADGSRAFAQKTYEQSSLNRPLAARKSGVAYSESGAAGVKETAFAYNTNATGEVLLIKLVTSSGSTSITSSGYYTSGKLNKTVTTNEDGQTTEVFTGYDGNTVLSRVQLDNNATADTYYVYDGAGRTAWVITPEGSAVIAAAVASSGSATWTLDSSDAKAYAYRYTYDGLGRMTEKRIPGAEAVYMVYDPAGRVVATQDGVQRASNQWILTRYNAFDEETERYLSAAFTRVTIEAAFSSSAYPQSIYGAAGNTLLLQRQYGGTRPQGAPAFSTVSDVVTADSLSNSNAGRVVWEIVYDDNTSNGYAERSFFYDARGRLRQSVECDPLGGTLRTSVLPDYVGNALRTVISYTIGQSTFAEETTNTYDTRGRVLTSVTSAQGASEKTTYAYDALGRVKGADYGPVQGTAVLSVRDSVNVQGFRTESTAILNGGTNVYSQTLRYYDPQKGTSAKYSGMISEWAQNQGTDTDTYGFTYDAAGRLTVGTRYAGASTTGTAAFTERGISYDKAGGMLALQRYGQNASSAEDNISLTYNGMRLSAVTGTVGGQSINASFTYDDCGRTTYDGVSALNYVYDQMGALASVSDASTSTTLTTYRHLADGTKYATVSPSGGALIYRGPFTLKVADISASTPSVSFLRAETGSAGAAIIANASGTGAAPYYYVADHIGSIRAIVDAQGNIVERNDYYTYGKRHTTGRTYADLKSSPLLFSGKEDQGQALDLASGTTTPSDLRILDFGARHYDSIVPRWTTQDPLAEKYFPINPYAYCAGDPVNYFDVEGMDRVPKAPSNLLGTSQYYRWREDRYVERTGKPSSYYGVYGLPNANKFELLKALNLLSERGNIWVQEVEYSLQIKLENALEKAGDKATEWEDAQLEKMAFKHHVSAYINSDGTVQLNDLPTTDLLLIVSTPKASDIFSCNGLKQVVEIMAYLAAASIKDPVSFLYHIAGLFDSSLSNKVLINIIIQKIYDDYLSSQNEQKENESDE